MPPEMIPNGFRIDFTLFISLSFVFFVKHLEQIADTHKFERLSHLAIVSSAILNGSLSPYQHLLI